MTFFFDHPVMLFLIAFAVLGLVAQVGFRIRQAYGVDAQDALHEQVKEARDGIVFLLSLLLGFTLAMALTRYDQRKQLVVDEANDIGTTELRARLLPETYSSRLMPLMAEYADARLAYFQAGHGAKSIAAASARTKQIQNQIWDVTQQVARTTPTPITSAFIQSLNEAIDITERHTASLENRIPLNVWLMIMIIAVLACLASGLAVRRRVIFSMLLTPLMAAVVMSLTADLDSPRTGLVQVGANSIERVHADLHPASPPKQDQ